MCLDPLLTDNKPSPADLDMTPKALGAFGTYLAFGPQRSFEKLANAEPTLHVAQLKRWSKHYGWQERLRRIAQAQIDAANEQRLAIWLRTIGVYDKKTQEREIQKLALSDVHGIHDRVRPQEQGSVSVGVGTTLIVNIGDRSDGPQ